MRTAKISRRKALSLLGTVATVSCTGCSRWTSEASKGASHDSEPIYYLGLTEVAQRIQSRQLSSVDLTNTILSRIAAIDSKLNSYVTLMRDQALESAHRADEEIRNGKYRGPLHGVPVAVKDLCF